MDEIAILLILLGGGILLSGPIAFILALVALSKVNRLIDSQRYRTVSMPAATVQKTPAVMPVKPPVTEIPIPVAPPAPVEKSPVFKKPIPQVTYQPVKVKEALEQRIGTKWILVAGIITVMVGCIFFLKYAVDNKLFNIGPLGRIVTASVCGIIALIVGEITRRREYDVVAKGVTALGFAMLYATIFTAYRLYHLIDPVPAFGLAIAVTAAAMLYAVILNEILIAFLSLLGGFIAPAILSSGENLPMSLFGYVTILSLGAMFCSYYRKWRAINWLCFIGTFALYTGWFEEFFRDTINTSQGHPEQMAAALGWLSVFFVIFLIMPVVYELFKKIDVRKEDVCLIITNSLVAFYYLCTILFENYRTELSISVAALGIVHLLLMLAASLRLSKDSNLKITLLVIGLSFITAAIPLYFKVYALSVSWGIKAVVICVIGIRYRSRICQLSAVVSVMLCIGNLLYRLPMHSDFFRLFINPAFGTWLWAGIVLLAMHLLYRFTNSFKTDTKLAVSQLSYLCGIVMIFATVILEWYYHCYYNMAGETGEIQFLRIAVLITSAVWLLLLVRPLCPEGKFVTTAAIIVAAAAMPVTIYSITQVYRDGFIIFANSDFLIGLIFVCNLFAAMLLIKRQQGDNCYSGAFGVLGVLVLWMLLTLQVYYFWYCRDKYMGKLENWNFMANMNISILWAVYAVVLMIVGFIRKIPMVRYIALGLFALLLGKIFIYDTRNLESIYRIAAFLATGIIMVCVSYLYQFLKKKGFFDTLMTKAPLED